MGNFDDLPWEQIKEISEKGIFEEVFKKIPKARFEFVANEANREALIESALKSLKKKNPDATYEQAVMLTDIMQEFARKALEWKNI
ncbi:MAG: hypothetical protein M1308_03460 [Actinobacteria bacterium]|nr:hypothetical protein [Patescibacteria group bacterium]MCL5069938.1 hypothetical protein [Actinomycetota bacterium]